jgi:hypothetical protein
MHALEYQWERKCLGGDCLEKGETRQELRVNYRSGKQDTVKP